MRRLRKGQRTGRRRGNGLQTLGLSSRRSRGSGKLCEEVEKEERKLFFLRAATRKSVRARPERGTAASVTVAGAPPSLSIVSVVVLCYVLCPWPLLQSADWPIATSPHLRHFDCCFPVSGHSRFSRSTCAPCSTSPTHPPAAFHKGFVASSLSRFFPVARLASTASKISCGGTLKPVRMLVQRGHGWSPRHFDKPAYTIPRRYMRYMLTILAAVAVPPFYLFRPAVCARVGRALINALQNYHFKMPPAPRPVELPLGAGPRQRRQLSSARAAAAAALPSAESQR